MDTREAARLLTQSEPESGSQSRQTPQARREHIWDLPLRLFHWALTACVLAGWYLGYYRDFATIGWHFWLGYAVCGLLGFRITGGIIGPRTARFSSLIWPPHTILSYAATLFRRTPSRFPGHSPIGSCSVIALLLSLSVQVLTGLCAEDDGLFARGPLADFVSPSVVLTMTNLRYINSRILLSLIGLHLIAVTWYLVWKRENLFSAMVTGGKIVNGGQKRA